MKELVNILKDSLKIAVGRKLSAAKVKEIKEKKYFSQRESYFGDSITYLFNSRGITITEEKKKEKTTRKYTPDGLLKSLETLTLSNYRVVKKKVVNYNPAGSLRGNVEII